MCCWGLVLWCGVALGSELPLDDTLAFASFVGQRGLQKRTSVVARLSAPNTRRSEVYLPPENNNDDEDDELLGPLFASDDETEGAPSSEGATTSRVARLEAELRSLTDRTKFEELRRTAAEVSYRGTKSAASLAALELATSEARLARVEEEVAALAASLEAKRRAERAAEDEALRLDREADDALRRLEKSCFDKDRRNDALSSVDADLREAATRLRRSTREARDLRRDGRGFWELLRRQKLKVARTARALERRISWLQKRTTSRVVAPQTEEEQSADVLLLLSGLVGYLGALRELAAARQDLLETRDESTTARGNLAFEKKLADFSFRMIHKTKAVLRDATLRLRREATDVKDRIDSLAEKLKRPPKALVSSEKKKKKKSRRRRRLFPVRLAARGKGWALLGTFLTLTWMYSALIETLTASPAPTTAATAAATAAVVDAPLSSSLSRGGGVVVPPPPTTTPKGDELVLRPTASWRDYDSAGGGWDGSGGGGAGNGGGFGSGGGWNDHGRWGWSGGGRWGDGGGDGGTFGSGGGGGGGSSSSGGGGGSSSSGGGGGGSSSGGDSGSGTPVGRTQWMPVGYVPGAVGGSAVPGVIAGDSSSSSSGGLLAPRGRGASLEVADPPPKSSSSSSSSSSPPPREGGSPRFLTPHDRTLSAAGNGLVERFAAKAAVALAALLSTGDGDDDAVVVDCGAAFAEAGSAKRTMDANGVKAALVREDSSSRFSSEEELDRRFARVGDADRVCVSAAAAFKHAANATVAVDVGADVRRDVERCAPLGVPLVVSKSVATLRDALATRRDTMPPLIVDLVAAGRIGLAAPFLAELVLQKKKKDDAKADETAYDASGQGQHQPSPYVAVPTAVLVDAAVADALRAIGPNRLLWASGVALDDRRLYSRNLQNARDAIQRLFPHDPNAQRRILARNALALFPALARA
eukprot:CAMPEP_0118910006 /NCGR_PEP_ID=MMETSP1166-20130328/12334_1 /TAXON_ID=1104430 /ORGANISM="Chrysoreinhardia sp, Strain CCMP3193" /LENGTH=929 /DNA_ID=CAMNT_0006849461 /DNA_START=100 /DNA_END=2890 /DNA_ORIENTATION=-